LYFFSILWRNLSKFVTQTDLYRSKQLETTFNQFGKNKSMHIIFKDFVSISNYFDILIFLPFQRKNSSHPTCVEKPGMITASLCSSRLLSIYRWFVQRLNSSCPRQKSPCCYYCCCCCHLSRELLIFLWDEDSVVQITVSTFHWLNFDLLYIPYFLHSLVYYAIVIRTIWKHSVFRDSISQPVSVHLLLRQPMIIEYTHHSVFYWLL